MSNLAKAQIAIDDAWKACNDACKVRVDAEKAYNDACKAYDDAEKTHASACNAYDNAWKACHWRSHVE